MLKSEPIRKRLSEVLRSLKHRRMGSAQGLLRRPRESSERRPLVVVVGPAPGQAGGISSVMSYLEMETARASSYEVRFIDTMKNGRWSITKFMRVSLETIIAILVCRASLRPAVFHLNVSTGGSTYRKWFISRLCKISSTPYVVHLHGSKYRKFFAQTSPLVRNIVLMLFGSADSVIVLGKIWQDYVVDELGVESSRVAVIANGTPELPDMPRQRSGKSEKVRVVFSGRLSEQKGVPELLKAADLIYESFQDFEIVLMGDSRDAELLSEARSRPYSLVTGWLSHEQVVQHLASADVFTLPSHDEGLPMAMIEAMSLGLPVIVTRVGAIPDVIENGKEGYLIEAGDSLALSASIKSLVVDHSLRQEMGRHAYNRWLTELGSGQMACLIEDQWNAALTPKSIIEDAR